jgi:large subunit ribosomal protein L15
MIYNLVSLHDLNIFEEGSTVDHESLIAVGILKNIGPVKILANGDIEKGLKVKVDKISESAKEKIIAAGGTVED